MDEFDKYLLDMQKKYEALYNQYVEDSDNLDESDDIAQDKLWDEYTEQNNELINTVRDKTAKELSIRYNLNKDFCWKLTRYMGATGDIYDSFSSDFFDVKKYARFAKYVLDEHKKGEV